MGIVSRGPGAPSSLPPASSPALWKASAVCPPVNSQRENAACRLCFWPANKYARRCEKSLLHISDFRVICECPLSATSGHSAQVRRMSVLGCDLNRSTQHSDGDIEERVCGGNHVYHQALQGNRRGRTAGSERNRGSWIGAGVCDLLITV